MLEPQCLRRIQKPIWYQIKIPMVYQVRNVAVVQMKLSRLLKVVGSTTGDGGLGTRSAYVVSMS
jgi:hypothetical protein